MAGFSSLLQAIPSIIYGMKGVNNKPQKRLAGQIEQVAQARTDTNNPLYQQIYGQQRQQGQQNIAELIAELMRQNRKSAGLGRVPALSAERGGEQVFRNLTRGYQDVQNQAANNTQNILSQGQNALTGASSAYQGVANQDFSNNVRRAGAAYSAGDALKELFGL